MGTLTICSDDHDEIAYEGNGKCPLCDMREDKNYTIEELEKDVASLKDKVKSYEESAL